MGDASVKETWRNELRARQQHREYQGLVSDLRKTEIEQVCVFGGGGAENARGKLIPSSWTP